MSSTSRRTLVFGIDGGTWEVLNPLLKRGLMPHLQRLQNSGAWGNLQSVVPVNSAAAWSSFLTGTNPETHGVYDFLSWKPGTAERTAVNASWLPRPTLFDLLKDRGPLLALKVPMTYPPWPIPGAMISGLPTPDDESAFTYPADLAGRLNPLILKNSSGRSWEVEGESRHLILDQLELAQQSLERLTDALLAQYSQTQVCFVVARDVDELQHFFWDALTQPDSPYLPRLERYFQRLDQYLGRMLEWAGSDARIVIMSDHGFGPISGIWHLNEWLRSHGFLRLHDNPQKGRGSADLGLSARMTFACGRRLLRGLHRWHLKGRWLEKGLERLKFRCFSQADLQGIDWNSTLAYCGNVGEEWLPLFINLQGREPQGVVTPEQYAKVREDLRETLLNNHVPEVQAVLLAEEVFDITDPRQASAPDLLVLPAAGGVQSDFLLGGEESFEPSRYRRACHRRAGMFLLHGPEVEPAQGRADLVDIPATILAWLSVPVPKYFAGRPVREFIAGLSQEMTAADSHCHAASRQCFTEEEEAGVRQKLESLGYL